MSRDLDVSEQFICDECGYTSPVANERCPDCGSAMSSLEEDEPKATNQTADDDDDLVDDTFTAEHPGSLEALQSEELGESDRDYQNDSYGSE